MHCFYCILPAKKPVQQLVPDQELHQVRMIFGQIEHICESTQTSRVSPEPAFTILRQLPFCQTTKPCNKSCNRDSGVTFDTNSRPRDRSNAGYGVRSLLGTATPDPRKH